MELFVHKKRWRHPAINQELSLNEVPQFKHLTENELLHIELNSTQISYKKGIVIYREGTRHSGIYCIAKGIVKIYKIGPNGKPQIIRFAKKGDFIAYQSLLTNELASTSAKTSEDTVVYHIPYQVLLHLLQSNWRFTHEMMKIACIELRQSNTFVTDLAQKSVRERTAEILLFLRDQFGLDMNNALQIKVTRKDLANMVGTVPESLIRVMSEFKSEKLLAYPGRKIVFLNLQKLLTIANS